MATNIKVTPGHVAVTFAASFACAAAMNHFGSAVMESGVAWPQNIYAGIDGWLPHILAHPLSLSGNQMSLSCSVFGFGLPWLWWWWLLSRKGNYRPGEEHGSARWMTKDEMKFYGDTENPDNNLILSKNARMVLSPKKFDLERDRNKNVLVIGGPGSGKTRYIVKPCLMQLNSSVWITDPKGTLLPETAQMFVDAGYELKTLNTIDFNLSMHFNPFAYIASTKDIPQLVQTIVQNVKPKDAGKASDPFWENTEKMLLCALVGYMYEALPFEERTFRTLNKLIGLIEVSESGNAPASPLDLLFREWETGSFEDPNAKLSMGGHSVPAMRGRGQSNGDSAAINKIKALRSGDGEWSMSIPGEVGTPHPESYAVAEYKKFTVGAGKTLKSVLMTVNSDLWQFDLPEVLELTDYDEMDLDSLGGLIDDDLDERATKDPGILKPGGGTPCGRTKRHPGGQRKTAMYVIMDDSDSTYGFLVATLTYLGFNRIKSYADRKAGGKLPIPVQFYLDEFANIGKIADFQQLITTLRSRNIAVTIILQSLSQLDSVYGKEEAGIIKGACDSWVYLGGSDMDTNEEISKTLGNQTVNNRNMSKTYAAQRSSSASEQILQRALMDASEVSRMKRRNCLVMIRNTYGFLDDKYVIEDHPRYELIDPGHKGGKRGGIGPWHWLGKAYPKSRYDEDFDMIAENERRRSMRLLSTPPGVSLTSKAKVTTIEDRKASKTVAETLLKASALDLRKPRNEEEIREYLENLDIAARPA